MPLDSTDVAAHPSKGTNPSRAESETQRLKLRAGIALRFSESQAVISCSVWVHDMHLMGQRWTLISNFLLTAAPNVRS